MQERWRRLWAHLRAARFHFQYFAEAVLLLADAFWFPEILLFMQRVLKRNIRPLNSREVEIARSVFGDRIDYQKVRIDTSASIGCRRYGFAYVSFHCINSWGTISDAHFIHEMVHVWQFQRFGSVYIFRALHAQRTPEGYNYGGIGALWDAAEQGRGLLHFNWEQQGDIVADYFCLKNGLQPRWCRFDPDYLPVFERVIM